MSEIENNKSDMSYVSIEKQMSARKEKRLEAYKRRQTLKKALAVLAVLGIGAAGIARVDAVMSDKDKTDVKPTTTTTLEYDEVTYDDYIDYVQETNGVISEEGYKAFMEEHNTSKGARK